MRREELLGELLFLFVKLDDMVMQTSDTGKTAHEAGDTRTQHIAEAVCEQVNVARRHIIAAIAVLNGESK